MSTPTLIDNLNQIASIKSDIKSAIENKGVDMTGLSFADYPTAISQITGGGGASLGEITIDTNGKYYAVDYGYDGFSYVKVYVSGYTERNITEGSFTQTVVNLSNYASIVGVGVFYNNWSLRTVDLINCTTVMSYAFQSCANLSQVNIPMVSTFGASAFKDCYALSDFYVESGGWNFRNGTVLNVFENCSALGRFYVPKANQIGSQWFWGCTQLSQVVLSTNYTLVKDGTFFSCYSLSQIEDKSGNTLSGIITVGDYAFKDCSSLSSFIFDKVTSIGADAFEGTAISSVTLNSCTFVNYSAFKNCSQLTYMSLNVGRYHTFQYLDGMLEGTPIASGTGSIYVDEGAYSYWMNNGWSSFSSVLVSIPGPGTGPLISFHSGRLYGRTLDVDSYVFQFALTQKESVTSIDLPNVTSVSAITFEKMSNLVSVSLPECSNCGFRSCSSLTDVYLPKLGVANGTFYGCSALSSVSLPAVFAFRNSPFRGTILDTIVLGYGELIPYMNNLFQSTPIESGTGSIYVPASLVSDYKTAYGWSSFASQIFPISE